MKIWEAIKLLQQMDQTKDVTISFDEPKKAKFTSNNKEVRLVSPAYYEQFKHETQYI